MLNEIETKETEVQLINSFFDELHSFQSNIKEQVTSLKYTLNQNIIVPNLKSQREQLNLYDSCMDKLLNNISSVSDEYRNGIPFTETSKESCAVQTSTAVYELVNQRISKLEERLIEYGYESPNCNENIENNSLAQGTIQIQPLKHTPVKSNILAQFIPNNRKDESPTLESLGLSNKTLSLMNENALSTVSKDGEFDDDIASPQLRSQFTNSCNSTNKRTISELLDTPSRRPMKKKQNEDAVNHPTTPMTLLNNKDDRIESPSNSKSEKDGCYYHPKLPRINLSDLDSLGYLKHQLTLDFVNQVIDDINEFALDKKDLQSSKTWDYLTLNELNDDIGIGSTGKTNALLLALIQLHRLQPIPNSSLHKSNSKRKNQNDKRYKILF